MAQIHKSSVRKELDVRREPHWPDGPTERGLYVGFRKLEMGGNWIARWRDDEGIHRYHSLGPVTDTFDFEAAEKAAKLWKKNKAAGVNTDEVQTVADICRAYITDRKDKKGKANAHDTEMRFKRTVYEHPIGKVELSRLTERRVEEWRNELVKPEAEGGHGLARASANRNLTVLKAALNFAVTKRYVPSERAIEWTNVEAYSDVENPRKLYLDLGQRRKLLETAKGAVRDLIEGVMLTGARAGELTSALRSQFDHRTGEMTLKGKTGPRTFQLTPVQLKFFKRLGRNKLPAAYLFTRDDGEPWGHSDWDELVRDAAKEAELPEGVCLYTLRHSYITAALLGHTTTLEVSRRVGTSLEMIQKHYGHISDAGATERLGKISFV